MGAPGSSARSAPTINLGHLPGYSAFMYWHWRSVEREVGPALGRAYPWLLKVGRLPGGGPHAPCAMRYGVYCANDEPHGFGVGDEWLPPGPLRWSAPNPWRND